MSETQQEIHIRWMIRSDMKCVMSIEEQLFADPWSEDEFVRCLRQRSCIGLVAEFNQQPIGYMIYQLHRDHLSVITIAVQREYQRRGFARRMIAKLVGKLSDKRHSISTVIPDDNLQAQTFFREIGFKAKRILRDYFKSQTRQIDAFEFRFCTASKIQSR